MPRSKEEMREYQRRRRVSDSRCQGCGLEAAEEYHRVNQLSPGLRLCAVCAEVLALVLQLKQTPAGAGALKDTLARVKAAVNGEPDYAGKTPREAYCAACIDGGHHLRFEQFRMTYWPRGGECVGCLAPVAPPPPVPVAALPPGVTPAGVFVGPTSRHRIAAPPP